MIPVSRFAVLLIVCTLAIVGAPMALGSVSPFENPATVTPIVLAAEFIVYFLFTFFSSPRMTLSTIALLSLGIGVTRCVASLLAGAMHSLILPELATPGFFELWVGNPVSVIVQMIALMVTVPHVLDIMVPGILGRDAAPAARPRGEIDSSPSGGFVQAFSFQDLSGVVRKAPGLEGFLVFSKEGLVVWKEIPIRLETDVVVSRLMHASSAIGQVSESGGLGRLRRTFVQTREHLLCIVELNANFGMILVYSGRTKLADCEPRVDVLAKTAREFLQWKYPGLSMATASMSRTAIPVGL